MFGPRTNLLVDYLRPRLRTKFGFIADVPAPETDSRGLIPNKMFQTGESRLLDARHLEEIEKFRILNPDLGFAFFDSGARDHYMESEWAGSKIHDVYLRSHFNQMKADIFRYCIIFDRGGYYMDINKACMTSLRALHSESDRGIIGFETHDVLILPPLAAFSRLQHPDKFIGQWCFGFSAGHEILARIIENIETYADAFSGRKMVNPKNGVLMISATGMFTKTVHEFLVTNEGKDLRQAGVGFNESLVFRLRGSRNTVPPTYGHYSDLKNRVVLG